MSRRGGEQPFDNFRLKLDLRVPFGEPDAAFVPTPKFDAALDWIETKRPMRQNFWPGLSLALLLQAEKILRDHPTGHLNGGFEELLIETTTTERVVNTLNVRLSDDAPWIKLRPIYNEVLDVISGDLLREHPKNEAHATQAWRQYRDFIDLIYQMNSSERSELALTIWDTGILTRPEFQLAQVRDREVRIFESALKYFPRSHKGVPGGCGLQGLVFGYFIADSPNLIIESHKVNTGSSRARMLGDVDGFRGSETELSAEVKDLHLTLENLHSQLGAYLEDISRFPNVTAVVACASIDEDARSEIESRNIQVMDLRDMIRAVSVWDLPKQEEAVRGASYYYSRIQGSSAITAALGDFVESSKDGAANSPSPNEESPTLL